MCVPNNGANILPTSKNVHETSLNIMDAYLTYNPFPDATEQHSLAYSLEIVNKRLLESTPKLKALLSVVVICKEVKWQFN